MEQHNALRCSRAAEQLKNKKLILKNEHQTSNE
jgi:hypothetical protein